MLPYFDIYRYIDIVPYIDIYRNMGTHKSRVWCVPIYGCISIYRCIDVYPYMELYRLISTHIWNYIQVWMYTHIFCKVPHCIMALLTGTHLREFFFKSWRLNWYRHIEQHAAPKRHILWFGGVCVVLTILMWVGVAMETNDIR